MEQVIPYWAYPGLKIVKINPLNFKSLIKSSTIECLNIVRDVILEEAEISVEQFHSRSRITPISYSKQLFCYIVKEIWPKYKLIDIGRYIYTNPRTKRSYDHTSVLHCIKCIADRLDIEPEFQEVLTSMQSQVSFKLQKLLNE